MSYKTPTQSKNPNKNVHIGSVSKIFTTVHLLEHFSPEQTFTIELFATNEPSAEGKLEGDIIIHNSGDYNLDGLMEAKWVDENLPHFVANIFGNAGIVPDLDPAKGIKKCAKGVSLKGIKNWVGQLRFEYPFEPQETAVGLIHPLTINDGCIDVVITPEGARLLPDVPGWELNNDLVVRPEEGCTSILIDAKENVVTITGQIYEGEKQIVRNVKIEDPEDIFKRIFFDTLIRHGVAHVDEPRPGTEKISLYTLPSKPFSEILKLMNKVSNNITTNYYPFVMYKTKQEALNQLNQFYRGKYGDAWVDFTELHGEHNKATAEVVYNFMNTLKQHKYFETVYNSLPIMGKDGTLSHAWPHPKALSGKVVAKTGTRVKEGDNSQCLILDASLAGYVLKDEGGKLAKLPFFIGYDQTHIGSVNINSLEDGYSVINSHTATELAMLFDFSVVKVQGLTVDRGRPRRKSSPSPLEPTIVPPRKKSEPPPLFRKAAAEALDYNVAKVTEEPFKEAEISLRVTPNPVDQPPVDISVHCNCSQTTMAVTFLVIALFIFYLLPFNLKIQLE